MNKKNKKKDLAIEDFQWNLLSRIKVILQWNAPVDLDLQVYYSPKNSVSGFLKALERAIVFFFRSIGLIKRNWLPGEGVVSYLNKGSKVKYPFIWFYKDKGIRDVGGEKQEEIIITSFGSLAHALIVVNIFDKSNVNFSDYNGRVIIKNKEQEVVIPIVSCEIGSYYLVAHVDNTGSQLVINDISEVLQEYPTIVEFLKQRKN